MVARHYGDRDGRDAAAIRVGASDASAVHDRAPTAADAERAESMVVANGGIRCALRDEAGHRSADGGRTAH